MVDPEIGCNIPDKEVGHPICLADPVQGAEGEQETEIAEQDQISILGLVQRALGVEVIDTASPAVTLAFSASFALRLVVVVAGDVEEEICGPPSELLDKQGIDGDDGGLFGEFLDLVNKVASLAGILVLGDGHKHHVAGHVSSGFVMFAMGDLPRKVGNEQKGVAEPSHGVVEDLAGGERLMTTFVGKNPQASADQTVDDGIQEPQCRSYGGGGDVLGGDETVEEIEGGAQADQVSSDIVETLGSRPLEAVLGNGFVDVIDGVVGDLKGISIGVDERDLGVCSSNGSGLLEHGIF